MKKIICLAVVILSLTFNARAQSKDALAIRSALNEQLNAWNKGDLKRFMGTYWQTDSLMFIGSRGITYGWKATLDNYKKRYPDRATMGTLKFDFLKLDFFNKNTTCWLLGTWHLTRPEKGDVGGYFTLMLKKIKGKWLIISDHTS